MQIIHRTDIIIGYVCLLLGSVNIAFAAKFTQEELAFMSASVQLELYRQKILSPVDVIKAQIERFNKTNDKINAATYTHFETALEQARAAEQRYINGTYRILEGISVGVKDEHYAKGWVVTQGSLIHKNDAPKDHADPIVKKLKAAGAILLIQTTVPELYLNFSTSTKAWGVTRNPWNLQYSVGGSSGGSGAALAAGYVTLATGSDMGGSIRIPAAFNGVYGYKPAFGQIHTDSPLSHFSGSGPMARTFADLVLMQNVMAGPDEYSVNTLPARKLASHYDSIKGMKIAYVGGMGIIKPSKDVQAAMDKAIKILQAQGAVVKRVNLDVGLDADGVSEELKKIVLAGAMGGAFIDYADKLEQMTDYAAYFVSRANQGEYGNQDLFQAEVKIKQMYQAIVDSVFAKGYVAMLAPTLPTSHIPADYDFTKDKVVDDGVEYPALLGSLYTIPFNMLNWMPVISAPVSLSSQNMPIGVQIVGKAYNTDTVYRVAYSFSKAAPRFYRDKLMPANR